MDKKTYELFFNVIKNTPMTQLNISPALLVDLQKVLSQYSYKLVCANGNPKQGNHRYIFTDDTIKILIEFSHYELK